MVGPCWSHVPIVSEAASEMEALIQEILGYLESGCPVGWNLIESFLLVIDGWMKSNSSFEAERIPALPCQFWIVWGCIDSQCSSLCIRKFGNFMRQVGLATVDTGLTNCGCMIYRWV